MSVLTPDGVRVCYTYFSHDKPQALLLWCPGRDEGRGTFFQAGEQLQRRKIAFAVYDPRGSGESRTSRTTHHFQEYYLDMMALSMRMRSLHPSLPLFLGGHSSGGLMVARMVMEELVPHTFQGIVLSNPLIDFAWKVSTAKDLLYRFLARYFPTARLPASSQIRTSSGEKLMIPAIWYRELRMEQDRYRTAPHKLSAPTLMLLGGEDRVADGAPARFSFHRSEAPEGSRLIEYPGAGHSLTSRSESESQMASDLAEWILERVRG